MPVPGPWLAAFDDAERLLAAQIGGDGEEFVATLDDAGAGPDRDRLSCLVGALAVVATGLILALSDQLPPDELLSLAMRHARIGALEAVLNLS